MKSSTIAVNVTVILLASGFASTASASSGQNGTTSPARSSRHDIQTLYAFTGSNDGGSPFGLFADKAGNLSGTTFSGGAGGAGVVFKLAPNGTETTLYSFTGGNDGGLPVGLVGDKSGNLYGTALIGGKFGNGAVFQIAPDGTETVLHDFAGGTDGASPYASPILGKGGDLYGTTYQGGASNFGTIFKVSPKGNVTVLHTFEGGSADGQGPQAAVIEDKAGNLYGTTSQGGAHGVGTVFKLAPDGTFSILHSFANGTDGSTPQAGLISDDAGNLYGTTAAGGQFQGGTVFKIATDGTETVLHAFNSAEEGASPFSKLVEAKNGNLYGTTYSGGGDNPFEGQGVIFKLTPDGTEKVLHAFSGGDDGGYPQIGLIKDPVYGRGYFYGTASSGGPNGNGTVFRIKK